MDIFSMGVVAWVIFFLISFLVHKYMGFDMSEKIYEVFKSANGLTVIFIIVMIVIRWL